MHLHDDFVFTPKVNVFACIHYLNSCELFDRKFKCCLFENCASIWSDSGLRNGCLFCMMLWRLQHPTMTAYRTICAANFVIRIIEIAFIIRIRSCRKPSNRSHLTHTRTNNFSNMYVLRLRDEHKKNYLRQQQTLPHINMLMINNKKRKKRCED